MTKENEEIWERQVPEQATEEYSFDELAKGLASGTLSRGQALKLAGTAILGSLLGSGVLGMVPEVASARPNRRRGRRHKKPTTIATLPANQTCDSTNCASG